MTSIINYAVCRDLEGNSEDDDDSRTAGSSSASSQRYHDADLNKSSVLDSRRSRISTDNTMIVGLERDPITPLISATTPPDSDDEEYNSKKVLDGDGNDNDEGDDSSYGTAEIMVPEKDLDQDDGYESAHSPSNRNIVLEDAFILNETAVGTENKESNATVPSLGGVFSGDFHTPTSNKDPLYLPTRSHSLVLDSMRDIKKKLKLFDTYKKILNGSKHKNTNNSYSFSKPLTMRIRKPSLRRPTKGAVGSILSTIGGESELPEEVENRELYYNEVTWLLSGNGRWYILCVHKDTDYK